MGHQARLHAASFETKLWKLQIVAALQRCRHFPDQSIEEGYDTSPKAELLQESTGDLLTAAERKVGAVGLV